MRFAMLFGLIIPALAIAGPDKTANDEGKKQAQQQQAQPEQTMELPRPELEMSVLNDPVPRTVKDSKSRLMEAYDAGDEKFDPEAAEPDGDS